MIKKVEDFIIDNNMIKAEEKILVALSGGPDSVCLLHKLYSLKEKLNINLVISIFQLRPVTVTIP